MRDTVLQPLPLTFNCTFGEQSHNNPKIWHTLCACDDGFHGNKFWPVELYAESHVVRVSCVLYHCSRSLLFSHKGRFAASSPPEQYRTCNWFSDTGTSLHCYIVLPAWLCVTCERYVVYWRGTCTVPPYRLSVLVLDQLKGLREQEPGSAGTGVWETCGPLFRRPWSWNTESGPTTLFTLIEVITGNVGRYGLFRV